MKTSVFHVTLYAIVVYLIGGALQSAGVTTYLNPKEGHEPMKKHFFRFSLFLFWCFLILSMAGVQTAADVPIADVADVPFANVPFDVNNIPEPVPPPPAVVDFFDLSDFWQQWINIEGYPILASAKVNPYVLKELAWQIGQMFRDRPDLLTALAQVRETFTLIGHNEILSDIPEMQHLSVLFYRNVRARGGLNPRRGTSVEQVLGSASVPVHELAHDIHLWVFNKRDSTFDNRLRKLYDTVVTKGLWHGAAANYLEYWAEAVTVWFHVPQISPLRTREELKAYDPDVARLIAEVFGDNDWRDTPIESRLHLPHLQGFDLQSAPRHTEFPPGVKEAWEELRDPAIEERDEWVNLPPYDPSLIPRLNELRNRGGRSQAWTDILVANTIDEQTLFYWVNPDGTETLHYRFPPPPGAPVNHFDCPVGSLLLAKDDSGRPLAVFQAVEKTGRVIITPTFNLITLGLSKSSGDNQAAVSGALLANPFVVEVRDESLAVLEGVVVTFTVTAGNGTLSVTHTMTDKNGRAASTLTLGSNQGTNTVSVSAAGIEGTVTFNATAEAAIDIPDANLRAAIESALGKAEGDPITSSEMADLPPHLEAGNANISDLTGLEYATKLTTLDLWVNDISDISPLAGLTQLINLSFADNSIVNISALEGLTNLADLTLGGNSVTDISPVAGLTNLTLLHLPGNPVADISLVGGLTNLTYLNLNGTNISDISPVAGLTHLTDLYLGWNNITDLSPLEKLTDLTVLWLQDNNISDLSPLVANTGLGNGDEVNVDGNPLSYTSINTHIPTLRSRGVVVSANNLKPTTLEYLLSVSSGINLIHVPLKVTAVDGVAKTLTSISDLYDALGGANAVNFLITHDTSTQEWLSYSSTANRGTAADQVLTDDMGIVAGMKTVIMVQLRGNPLGTNGTSTITLNRGLNLVGLPLRDSRITRVSDLLSLDGIRGNVPTIILSDGGDFKSVGRAGDPGDVPITGGQGFILTAQQAATVTISGEGWTNVTAPAAAPKLLTGLLVTNTTPVLALKGEIVDEVSVVNQVGFRVAVKNLSTGRTVAATPSDDGAGYRLTIVDIETMRAAGVGDVLDISAQCFNPFIGVEPLRYTVTTEDVKRGLIRLPELVAYEIPKETELLANYPNPFNPETWIPYRLAEDADVKLTIYDQMGRLVRVIDVGHRVASVYESRSKAIYWDGRNAVGEQVASGVYFYQLRAGDYLQIRKMVILK